MAEPWSCADVRAQLPELALGVAPDDLRDVAASHLATCPGCRRELDDLIAVADDLLLLAPEVEPPADLADRVLLSIDPRPRHRRLPRVLLAAAAAVAVALLGVGLGWWLGSDDRDLAEQYRETLEVADGRYLTAAELTENGNSVGHVYVYAGSPSWVFVDVEGGPDGEHDVLLVSSDGQEFDIGHCTVEAGSGSWGRTVDVPLGSIDHLEMVLDGEVTMVAAID